MTKAVCVVGRAILTLALAAWMGPLSTASAGQTALQAEPAFSVRAYRQEDGLPASIITALAQDADGYLWVGTPNGLARFDGKQFVTWGSHGEPPLPYNEIRSLLADRNGGIWVGFNEGGVVSLLSGNRVDTFTTRDGLPEGVVFPYAQASDGAMWAVGPAGIAMFRGNRWEQLQGRDGLPPVNAYAVLEDRAGTTWVATAAGVFRRPRGHDVFAFVSGDIASSLAEDAGGGIWIVHVGENGIRHLPATADGIPARAPRTVAIPGNLMLRDHQGDLWVGSSVRGGLRHVSVDQHTSQPTVRSTRDDGGLLSKRVLALLEDRERNVWVGTTDGLFRRFKPSVLTYSSTNGLPSDNVRAIAALPNGDLWLGTSEGPARVAPRTGQPRDIAGLNGLGVSALHTDNVGRLWIAFATRRFGLLAHGRFSLLSPPDAMPRDQPRSLVTDAHGDLWFCMGNSPGVYRLTGGSLTRPHDKGSEQKTCTAALLDHLGRVWIGFDDGSLMVQEQDRAQFYVNGPRGRVCALHEDHEGTLWVASTAGLSRFRQGTFATLTSRNGLPSNYVSAVTKDDSGDLWLGVSSGIIRLSQIEFDHAVADPGYAVEYWLFDSSDGVTAPPNCYASPVVARDGGGQLWFATANGAVVVDPRRLPKDTATLTPRIEQVIADGNVVTRAPTRVSLPPRTSKLELDYTAVSLSAASKVRFRYRLDGFDPSWVDAGSRRQAFYTNLAPGQYRFQVQASVSGRPWSVTVWEFAVQPAFYQTRLFYGVTSGCLLLLVWGVWRGRVRALHQRYAAIVDERMRIGREIHDTVLQNMVGSALEIERLARRTRHPGVDAAEELTRISREVKEQIGEARQAIWELRSAGDPRADLSTKLRELIERLLAKTSVAREFVVSGTPRSCNPDVDAELMRIAREAIQNALRHADATRIRVELGYSGAGLRITITDDGCGFMADAYGQVERGHWGLIGMRERAQKIGAQFGIHSRPGGGTTIEVALAWAV